MDYSINSKRNSVNTIIGNAVVMLIVLLAVLLMMQQAADNEDTPQISTPLPSADPDPASCPNGGGGNCGTDIGAAPVGNEPGDVVGNPINLMSGNKHQSKVDFEIPGAMLSLRRMYNSGDSDSNRGLGMGWSHSYAVTLLDAGDGNLQIAQSDGGRINFYPMALMRTVIRCTELIRVTTVT